MKFEPVIIVHGGAWAIPDKLAAGSVKGVKDAVLKGYEVLLKGGSAIDAVEAAVVLMENDPVFDAGKGSVLNSDGEIEMDAVIMEGTELNAGAVACVQNVANPISLARLVMEKTSHVLLVGKGASRFASEVGMPFIDNSELLTEEGRAEWERFKNYKTTVNTVFNNKIHDHSHETVGAVAIDSHGKIACATSTGGITGKRPGRVGDSPLLGAGAYCMNEAGGVSCTGHGESIMKVCLAKLVTQFMQEGKSAEAAVRKGLKFMESRVRGAGGAVCISSSGEAAFHFTTERMAWASAGKHVLKWGLDPNEVHEEEITSNHS